MRERWRDRLRYVGRTLISPRRHHLELVALPRHLRWGYFVVKLGLDFAVTPAWKAFKAVGRFRATAPAGRDLP
jgi:hypothetical protein